MSAETFRTSISSWSHLSELIDHFSQYVGHDWLFRGVTNETYSLRPKIGRKSARSKAPYRINDERAVLSMFKQQARPHVQGAPTELEWLAIAQHYGLPTRLLDWTDSLLMSAWFAVELGGMKKVDSAIWVTKEVPSIDHAYSGEILGLGIPQIFRPPHISPRIAAQGSVLMICPTPCSDVHLSFAKKIIISQAAEFTLKKRLNACGINRRLLFPDLGGLSEHLAWMYKHDWLAGYRLKPDPLL